MRVLVISNCPLDPNQGSGYVINGYAQGLLKRGHEVDAYGPEDYVVIPRACGMRRLRLFIGYTLMTLRLVYFSKKKYEIVELWGGVGWLSILILTRLRLGRYAVVSRSNGLEPHYREAAKEENPRRRWQAVEKKINSWCDEVGFRLADSLTVVSRYDSDYAQARSYQAGSSLLMIENPVPDEWHQQDFSRVERKDYIGFVGTWNKNKGVSSLCGIIDMTARSMPDIHWIIAGIGKAGSRELATRTTVDHCEIYEYVDRSKLKELYRRMDILLFLSSYESFGMVCSEAMACGCLLMSTPVGFAAGLKDGFEYVRIDAEDLKGMEEMLRRILNDRSRCSEIRKAGYERVQQLRWDSAIDLLESHYHRLTSRQRH